jgi:hypothetical protein
MSARKDENWNGLKKEAHVMISLLKGITEDSLIYHAFASTARYTHGIRIVTIFEN